MTGEWEHGCRLPVGPIGEWSVGQRQRDQLLSAIHADTVHRLPTPQRGNRSAEGAGIGEPFREAERRLLSEERGGRGHSLRSVSPIQPVRRRDLLHLPSAAQAPLGRVVVPC